MAKGYGFEIQDAALVGAVLGAAYLVSRVVKPVEDITKPVGNLINTANNLIGGTSSSLGNAANFGLTWGQNLSWIYDKLTAPTEKETIYTGQPYNQSQGLLLPRTQYYLNPSLVELGQIN